MIKTCINEIESVNFFLFRLINLEDMVKKNGLEGPVAGNFIRNVYTEFVTDTFLCSLSRCSGKLAIYLGDLTSIK